MPPRTVSQRFIRFTGLSPGLYASRVNLVNVVNLFHRISGGATPCASWALLRLTPSARCLRANFPVNFPADAVNFPAAPEQPRFSSPQAL